MENTWGLQFPHWETRECLKNYSSRRTGLEAGFERAAVGNRMVGKYFALAPDTGSET